MKPSILRAFLFINKDMSMPFLNDFNKYFFFHNQTFLTEGRFVQFPNYGQIIFLVGGAGSGKNFVLQNMLGHNGVNCDVDDLKTYIAREKKFQDEKYADKGNEFLQDMDFKDPDKVFKMHNFSKKIFEPEGSELENSKLDGLLNAARQTKSKNSLPNIILNITGKDVHDFARLSVPFVEAGYSPKNVHIIWVLTPYKEASENNKNRDRVVPHDILRGTHMGVKKAMDIIRKSNGTIEYTHKGQTKMFDARKFIDGLVMIIFNSKGADSWIPNSKKDPSKKDFRLVTRNANEEGKNELVGIRHLNYGKLDYEDISANALSSRPATVDHINKIIIKEVGQEFKDDDQINAELENIDKWVKRQLTGDVKSSPKSQKKQVRRKQTGGKYVSMKNFDNFKNRVIDYTNFEEN